MAAFPTRSETKIGGYHSIYHAARAQTGSNERNRYGSNNGSWQWMAVDKFNENNKSLLYFHHIS